jgi:hypothetical protein
MFSPTEECLSVGVGMHWKLKEKRPSGADITVAGVKKTDEIQGKDSEERGCFISFHDDVAVWLCLQAEQVSISLFPGCYLVPFPVSVSCGRQRRAVLQIMVLALLMVSACARDLNRPRNKIVMRWNVITFLSEHTCQSYVFSVQFKKKSFLVLLYQTTRSLLLGLKGYVVVAAPQS